MTSPAALHLADLTVGYGAEPVLSNVDLRIEAGTVCALLGVNGAGKTTMIRAILGRIKPTSGRVMLAAGGVGLVPQEIALFPRLTVTENLSVFARLSGVPRRDVARRVADVIETTGLGPRRRQVVAALSGGWQRRANVAAAILHRPALLILDEPTAGIDRDARAVLHDLIRRMVADGIGVLLTTHDFAEAEALATHLAILAGGHIAVQGPVADLISARFGASLLLTLTPAARLDERQARSLREIGFTGAPDAPALLIADENDGLAAVARARAHGVTPRRIAMERPGIAALYAREVAA